ncbi:alkaline phosphatase family protein [Isoptericola sp. b441]|uniref:Alkaline phosphatase family protein n=1 Tax=Actinotalea lenta TaxID=3064654 RepID=A0ABT9D9F8_9CELL|nr:alkaline phosphatase family protein [Isoptericola sp. b441]MDO8107540.1 alkaline phosphatase family protein [Isoptericola sp. b441]
MRRTLLARDVRDAVLGACATAAGLLLASRVVAGLHVEHWWSTLAVALLVGALDTALRPILRPAAMRLGVPGAMVLGVLGQLVGVHVSLILVPGVDVSSWAASAATLGVVALVLVVVRWLLGADDRDYLVADLLRRARPAGGPSEGRRPGLVVVQIDGLGYPTLRHAIASGDAPTLAGWLRRGSHRAERWWSRVPSTTPAAQAGLLHGTNDGIPAFRWYDKAAGRLVVTNHPTDAALVEKRLSDGRGLLAGGGAAVSTMFSGDADTSLMVMSKAGGGGGLGPGGAYLRFFARPFVLARALMLTVGEILKEVGQSRRQRSRRVWPRVPRRGAYVLLRAVTNVLLRDLNVALVAEQMARGAPVVFVDLVDYDEIAHHSGVARREALDALAGVDAAIGTLERFAERCPREYQFVVLSDHGQSQGPTFAQLAGRSLEDLVAELIGVDGGQLVSATGEEEVWGPLATFLTDVPGGSSTRWAAGARHPERLGRNRRGDGHRAARDAAPGDGAVVAASGNVGLVWFPAMPGRVPVEALAERFPALVPGLLERPEVGFLVVDSARGPLAVGPHGVHVLRDGEVRGADPLVAFGPWAAADLLRVCSMPESPDVLVHSAYDEQAGEVYAFEELVGSHGGLGGDQNHAVLLHPSVWQIDPDLLDGSGGDEAVLRGADVVFRQLVAWTRRAGIRAEPGESGAAGQSPRRGPARARDDVEGAG